MSPHWVRPLLTLLIPGIVTAIYVYLVVKADRHEPEPKKVVALALAGGIFFAPFLSIVVEKILTLLIKPFPPLVQLFLQSNVFAPVVEEVAKGMVLLFLYKKWRDEMDGLVDGLVYGALVGFGFGLTETIAYLLYSIHQPFVWNSQLIGRLFLFGFSHALFTSFTGLGLGMLRWTASRYRAIFPVLGLGLAILAHATHNTIISSSYIIPRQNLFSVGMSLLMALLFNAGGLLVVLLILALALRQEKRIIQEELKEELEEGEYRALAASYGAFRRRQANLFGTSQEARALERHLIELAIKKYQMKVTSGKTREHIRRRVTQLRAEIAELREAITHGEDKL